MARLDIAMRVLWQNETLYKPVICFFSPGLVLSYSAQYIGLFRSYCYSTSTTFNQIQFNYRYDLGPIINQSRLRIIGIKDNFGIKRNNHSWISHSSISQGLRKKTLAISCSVYQITFNLQCFLHNLVKTKYSPTLSSAKDAKRS